MPIKENVKKPGIVGILSKTFSSTYFWIGSFSVLMVFAAQLSIPVEPVPFTLQTMLVLLSGAFLGARNGALSQIIYLTAGFIGLPVFANFAFGPAALFGPTGGYLLAFPFAAYFVGYILEKRNSLPAIVISMFVGSALILISGASFLSIFFNGNISEALFSGIVIFSLWDLLKIGAAISIYFAVSKRYPKLPA